MLVRWLLRILAGLVLLIAILAGVGVYLLQSTEPGRPALSGQPRSGTIKVGPLDRTYLVYAPARAAPRPALVIAFHGSMGSAQGMRVATGYGFDRLADRHGFVVAYPQGYAGNWNDCRKAADYPARRLDVDDLAFVQALVERLRRERGVDPSRVYVTGLSGGGAYALRLALEHPEKIAAAAVFAASLPTPANSVCRASGRPVPVLFVNGTRDPINPYAGGHVTLFGFADRGEALSAQASARYFAGLAGAAGPALARIAPRRRGDPTWAERALWRAADGREVALLTIHGGGHVVPQGAYRPQRLLGRVTTAVDGPREAWAFFRRQPPARAPEERQP